MARAAENLCAHGICAHSIAFFAHDAAALTAYVARTVWRAGYRYLGVDHESANLTARYFWRKHFAAYTYSLLRRL